MDDPYEDVWMVGVQWHPEDSAAARSGTAGDLRRALPRREVARVAGEARETAGTLPRVRPGRLRRRLAGTVRGRGRTSPRSARRSRDPCRARRSTSVPGLAAKPVIDIQVSVATIVPRAPIVDPLVARRVSTQSIDPIETEARVPQQGLRRRPSVARPRPRVRGRERVGAAAPRVPRCASAPTRHRRRVRALKRRLAEEHPRDIQTTSTGRRRSSGRSKSGRSPTRSPK